MNEVSIIGLDLAKTVFQAHGAAADGAVVFRRKLTRHQVLRFFAAQPNCVVAMEACCERASLGSSDWKPGTRGEADRAAVREAIRQAAEERRLGCRGNCRGG